MPDVAPTPVHFKEAIDFLRNKTNVPTRAWTDVWQGMHSRAFVVAGAARDELVADFHDAVTNAIASGTTLADFRKEFDRIVANHGWSYNGSRNWRSKVIFQTNMRTAYAAGKWQQAQRTKEQRPYMRYVAVLDSRTRDEHRAWHNTILPVDDPWWSTHFPPNGWNCRCSVQTLSAANMRANGWQVSDEAPPVNMTKETINTPEGQVTVDVPEGIDPGFGYNPGEAAFGHSADEIAAARHDGKFEPLIAPGAPPPPPSALRPERVAATLGPGISSEQELRAALRRAIGGDERTFDDPLGETVRVSQGLASHALSRNDLGRGRFFNFIPELIEDPQEIWAGFQRDPATGRVRISRRYLKLIDGQQNAPLLVGDQQGGIWQAITFFPSTENYRTSMRQGVRLYAKKGTGSGG
jgi:SPP1 gp7 family putative phage head morphogenesis protein